MNPRTSPRAPASDPTIPPQLRTTIRRKLLRWYDRHRRDLPWRRRADDPYAQWVAEIMLQQTRVETVLDYYDRFLRRFPTVDALGRARHQTVLKHWEGLGYYRRALMLHRAARQVHQSGGRIPDTADGLRQLPGVGDYTAAAISSIAFHRSEAAVDGNVARVVARLLGVTADVLSPEGRRTIQTLATQLLSRSRPGDFNQAWMDLGSAVCLPKPPRCDTCPLSSECVGLATGRAETLPVRDRRRRAKEVTYVVGVFSDGDRMWVRRRATGGLWSGLWEFPNRESMLSAKAAASRTIRSVHANRSAIDVLRCLAKEEGTTLVGVPERVGEVRHQLTHRSLTFDVWRCEAEEGDSPQGKASRRWVTRVSLERLPVSTATRRILTLLRSTLIAR